MTDYILQTATYDEIQAASLYEQKCGVQIAPVETGLTIITWVMFAAVSNELNRAAEVSSRVECVSYSVLYYFHST